MPEEKKAVSIEVPSKGGEPPSKEEEELAALNKAKELAEGEAPHSTCVMQCLE